MVRLVSEGMLGWVLADGHDPLLCGDILGEIMACRNSVLVALGSYGAQGKVPGRSSGLWVDTTFVDSSLAGDYMSYLAVGVVCKMIFCQ